MRVMGVVVEVSSLANKKLHNHHPNLVLRSENLDLIGD